jgi:hypothetical protein
MSTRALKFETTYFSQQYPYWDRSWLNIIERKLESYITDSYQYYSGGGCESVLHRLVSGHVVAYNYGLCFEVSKGCHWKSAKEYAESDMFGRESDYPKWKQRSVWFEGKSSMDEIEKVQLDIIELVGKARNLSEMYLRITNKK